MSAASETAEKGNYHLDYFYKNVRLDDQELRDGMSTVPEMTGSMNYHIYPAYENAKFDNQELHVGISAVTQTAGNDNYHIYPAYENATVDDQKLHAGMCAAPKTAERDNNYISPAYENATIDDQELHVGMCAAPKTAERDNNYISPAYENTTIDDQELHVGMYVAPKTAERNHNHIYPAYENASLDDQVLHVKMFAVPKTSETDTNYKNLTYENVGLGNQELRVMSDVPETAESIGYHNYSARENARFRGQEIHVGTYAVTQTAESDNYQNNNVYEDVILGNQIRVDMSTFPEIEESNTHYINSRYKSGRLDDQNLHAGMCAVSKTAENGNHDRIKPAYKNVMLGDQELKRRSQGQMVHKSIQLPKENLMRNPRSRMSLDPEKFDSGERFKCYINPSDKSTLINKFNEEKNASSDSQEFNLNAHREMISKSIQLPERVPRPRTRISFGPKKIDSCNRLSFHVNLAYESPMKINCTVEENAKPNDQELKFDSHREMIRKSIQLPEKGPKREPRIRMSVISATENSEESGKCHINLAYESTWDLNSKVDDNTSSNYQGGDRPAYHEIIRKSIQVPERQHRPRKLCCCSIT